MAVQFNLLPDVKLEYDRAQHAKKVVYTVSFLASVVAVGIFVIAFFTVNVLQKKLLDSANNDINTYSKNLKSIPDLDKILTVQNQLDSLPSLQSQKHYGSRLFAYLPQITPTNTSIGKLDLDTTASTIEITGTADKVESVNKFVDTLKFTLFTPPGATDQKSCQQNTGNWNSTTQICTKNAFSQVLLSKIDRDDTGAAYTIDSSFDPALFTGSSQVKLLIPQETTTRSVLNAPAAANPLFNGQTGTKSSQQQGAQ